MAGPAPVTLPISPLLVMHERYEAAWSAYAKIEAAENELDDSDQDRETLKSRYEDARKKIVAETDTLRVAILHQVPMSWADALILQYHAWCMADVLEGINSRPEDMREALLVGMETLFDFMAAEVADVDQEAIGPMIKGQTMLAWNRCRTRAAELEG